MSQLSASRSPLLLVATTLVVGAGACAQDSREVTASVQARESTAGDAAAPGTILGHLTGIQTVAPNDAYIAGWSCAVGLGVSISVEIFRGGTAADGGVLVGTYVANQPSSAGVSSQCGDTVGHDFKVLLPPSLRASFPGQRLYASGILPGSSPTSTNTIALTSDGGSHIYSMNLFLPETYGAKADGVTDSTAGMRAAIQAAIAATASKSVTDAEVLLGAGTYSVCGALTYKQSRNQDCLPILGAQHFLLGGAGAATELMFGAPEVQALFVGPDATGQHPQDVHMVGFTIDYQTPPFTQGVITNVNASTNTITVRLDPGMPLLSRPEYCLSNSPNSFGMLFSATAPTLIPNVPNFFLTTPAAAPNAAGACATPNADGSWDLVDSDGSTVGQFASVGNRYVQLARANGSAIEFYESTTIGLDGIVIHASPAVATAWIHNRGAIVINDLAIQRSPTPVPGTSPPTYRVLSTNADGIHMQQNWGTPLIKNSYFSAMADDAINIYSKGALVTSVASATSVAVATGTEIGAGDLIQVVNPASGQVRGQATVAATPGDITGSPYTLTLSASIAGMKVQDIVFDISAAGPSAVIRNNLVGSNREGRVFCKSSQATIANNKFADINISAIELDSAIDGATEGPNPVGVTVSGNVFVGGDPFGDGQIVVANQTLTGLSNYRFNAGFTVSNNQFQPAGSPAIFVYSASGIAFTRNTVWNGTAWAALAMGPQLSLSNVAAITIDGTSIGPGIQPTGLFAFDQLGYFSNGTTAYCGFETRAQFLACGNTQAEWNAAPTLSTLPWGMLDQTPCACGGY